MNSTYSLSFDTSNPITINFCSYTKGLYLGTRYVNNNYIILYYIILYYIVLYYIILYCIILYYIILYYIISHYIIIMMRLTQEDVHVQSLPLSDHFFTNMI